MTSSLAMKPLRLDATKSSRIVTPHAAPVSAARIGMSYVPNAPRGSRLCTRPPENAPSMGNNHLLPLLPPKARLLPLSDELCASPAIAEVLRDIRRGRPLGVEQFSDPAQHLGWIVALAFVSLCRVASRVGEQKAPRARVLPRGPQGELLRTARDRPDPEHLDGVRMGRCDRGWFEL